MVRVRTPPVGDGVGGIKKVLEGEHPHPALIFI